MRKSQRANKGKLPQRFDKFVTDNVNDNNKVKLSEGSEDDSLDNTIIEASADISSNDVIKQLMDRLTALEENSRFTTEKLLKSEAKCQKLQEELRCKNASSNTELPEVIVSNNDHAQYYCLTDAITVPRLQHPTKIAENIPCSIDARGATFSASQTMRAQTSSSRPVMSTVPEVAAYNSLQQSTLTSATSGTVYSHIYQPQLPSSYGTGAMQYAMSYPSVAANASGHQFASTANDSTSPLMAPVTYYGRTGARHLFHLPEFSGRAEDWPVFITSFNESSSAYSYTMLENTFRLQKCLKEIAYEEVKGLLINPVNVHRVIEQLQFRFGSPQLLINSQLQKARDIKPIAENQLEQLVGFSTKVQNLTTFLQNANAVQHLGNPTLLEELTSKMPMTKRIEWSAYSSQLKPYPTLLHFSEWVKQLATVIAMATVNMPPTSTSSKLTATTQHSAKHLLTLNEDPLPPERTVIVCIECAGEHALDNCTEFKNKSLNERWEMVKTQRLCFSCLSKGHNINICRRKKSCKVDGCKKVHNSLLHTPIEKNSNYGNNDSTQQINTMQVKLMDPETTKLLFKMLPVELRGPNGVVIRTMAFLDDGSSATLIDETIANKLGIEVKNKPLTLQWFGGKSTKVDSMPLNIEIKGMKTQNKWYKINARIVPKLDLPMQTINLNELHQKFHTLKNLPISEYINTAPKVLIGLDNCHVMSSMKSVVAVPSISAANTPLGWAVYGKPQGGDITTSYQLSIVMVAQEDVKKNIETLVEQYFTTENFGTIVPKQPLECNDVVRAREILENTTTKMEGRYETGLLWRYDDVVLPESINMATNRLYSIEAKMKRNAEFANAYRNAITHFVEKGYARKLSPVEIAATNPRRWYLPHFAVFNINKPGKLRLVFDAAATVDGVSLNSVLLKGPDEVQPLQNILFRFREHAIGLCADIREMFLQVRIIKSDTCAQRFLWRSDPNMPIETYVMEAMMFGATCSPCSAQFVKNKNAREVAGKQPKVIDAIIINHYVDDYVSSFINEEEALSIGRAVRDTHHETGFDLRSFISNSSNVQSQLNGEVQQQPSIVDMNGKGAVDKILGMHWDSGADEFIFQLNLQRVDSRILVGNKCPTKRQFMSLVMSVYDPFGMLANLMIYGKVLLQELWRTGTQWDDEIPHPLFSKFTEWVAKLQLVKQFRLKRCYSPKICASESIVELHIFSDASLTAFAAVAYWLIVTGNHIEVRFIAGKTKCAPLKMLSIPRLELQAAVLGTRLRNAIMEAHSIQPVKTIYWSDSKNVICWIKSEHRQYKTFVAHRISEILETTHENDWRWLGTKFNSAHVATRTKYPIEYEPNNKWVRGPEFLSNHESNWPTPHVPSVSEDADEEKRRCFLLTPIKHVIEFDSYSNFLRLQRTIAWVMRPAYIIRQKQKGSVIVRGPLTANELHAANVVLCRMVQREVYGEEISQLHADGVVSKGSDIYALTPRFNGDGLLCVFGRLDYAMCLPESARHPVILPKSHAFTKLVVKWFHEKLHHQNEEIIVNELRRRYWIPHLRVVVKRSKVNCQQCKNDRAMPKPTIMGQLPSDRVTPYLRPFTYTGLDYFGPMLVAIGRRQEKRWAALFTCMTTKTIHIELAVDLSTDACIVCIRNFVNRRGIPVKIRSDMGTNFVGADGELPRVNDLFDMEYLQNELSTKGITWEFNCPGNPSSGGCWERLIQAVKRVLAQSLNEKVPQVDTLRLLLIEAENIVNSRPLTHLPVSAVDLDPLTPNHFLLGTTNSTQTPGDEMTCLRKQYRTSQQLKNTFWRRVDKRIFGNTH